MVSERHWVRDWVTSGQPDRRAAYEVLRGPGNRLFLLTLQAQMNVTPASEIISQVSTEDTPLCLRVYSLERVARAFGVPIELLSQTTTEV